MKEINLLPSTIVNKIAAGEVIERPSSVVKELIENSLDARATSLKIEIEQAGRKLISVTDNGKGIAPEDSELVFTRHATSKIKEENDLYNISSLGFRGEALYSIASIADVQLISQKTNYPIGFKIHLRAGKIINCQPAAFSNGTKIEVRELFFNTPARKKFLKSDTTELRNIITVVTPYTLSFPEVKFYLRHNQRVLINLPANNLTDRICQALNLNSKNIIENEEVIAESGIKLKLILGDINIQRPRSDLQFIIVNHRPVLCKSISFALNSIYRNLIPNGRYPFFYVEIDLPAQDIDVNVHPSKREIKLKNERYIVNLISQEAEKILFKKSNPKQVYKLNPEIDFPQENNSSKIAEKPSQYNLLNNSDSLFEISVKESKEEKTYSADNFKQKGLKENFSQAEYLGSIMGKYLIYASAESLFIVDQHAAQERISYEQLLKQILENRIEIQNLLQPIIISVTPEELVIWEIIKENLNKLGFATSLWANNHIAIHSTPVIILNPEIAVRNILSGEKRTRFEPEELAKRACHNSLKAGYKMSKEQALFLKKNLLNCQVPFTCPHGRPTIIELENSFLEKQFLRK